MQNALNARELKASLTTIAIMVNVGNDGARLSAAWPKSAAVFGASGGIGRALVERLTEQGCAQVYAGSRSGDFAGDLPRANIVPFTFDLTDESSISAAAQMMQQNPPQWVIVATGALTFEDKVREKQVGPERTYKRLDPQAMANVFAINTIGPALIAKHILPLMPRGDAFTFAALSARVGSISDNGLGGWHSYRASKAALNMLIKNFAIEMGRTHHQSVVVGLHPGTVDSALSQPFQKGLAKGQLTEPAKAADNLLGVLASLGPEHSGCVFDFAGKEIAP